VIAGISLRRFRGFKELDLELKPLTVILGPNSAGKSAILQAIAALHYVHRMRQSPPALLAGKREWPIDVWPLDFGTRQKLQTAGTLADGGVVIALRDLAGCEFEYEFGGPEVKDLELRRLKITQPPQAPTQQAVSVLMPPGEVIAPAFELGDPVPLYTTTDAGKTLAFFEGDIGVERVPEGWRETFVETAQRGVLPGFHGLQLSHITRPTGTVHRVPSEAQAQFIRQLDAVRYLRADRLAPWRERESRTEGHPDDVGADGRWTADVLIDRGAEPPRQFRVPPRLPRTLADASRYVAGKGAYETIDLAKATNRWLAHLGLADAVGAARSGDEVEMAVQLHGTNRQLPDIGFGISQVLPLIVQGLALEEKQTMLAEQPEAQLHPRPQAQLADFFCDLIEQGRRVIIETHSEPLFDRLRVRALLDPDLASKIAVYFVDASSEDGCCKPALVPLTEASAVAWPTQFRAEAVDESLALAAAKAATLVKGS